MKLEFVRGDWVQENPYDLLYEDDEPFRLARNWSDNWSLKAWIPYK